MTHDEPTTTVLITGATRGLGHETARRLGRSGWRLLLGARDETRGAEVAEKLAADGVDATVIPLDVTSDDSVQAAVRQVSGLIDGLDVLINNAGILGEPVGPEDTGPDHFLPVFGVNLLGPVRVTRAFLPLLRAGNDPRVVMVSSGMGSFGVTSDPDRVESGIANLTYTSSKAALNMVTTQYAKAIPEVRFDLVDPGYTATDFNHHTGTQSVTEGTDAIVAAARATSGASGTYRDRQGEVPW